jgi:plastocyanin
MSTKIYIIIGAVIIVLLGGLLFLQYNGASKQPAPGAGTPSVLNNNQQQDSFIDVLYTNSGYLPKEVFIHQGGRVTFHNETSQGMWPASAMHPTHTVYPGSNITKCFSGEQEGIFDSCGEIAPGESWSFIFNEAGTWGYHDHRHPASTGKIIVE